MMRSTSVERGFTLIEVMFSVLLTAIAVIGMMALFRINASASSNSRHQTEASILAQDKLEILRMAAIPASATENTLNDQGKTVTGGLYTRVSTVTPSGTQYVLKVVVSWDEDGTPKSVTLRGMR